MIREIRKHVALLVYYAFAWFLPGAPVPGHRLGYWIRRWLVKGFVEECGLGVEVKAKAYLGRGTGIRLGDNCRIGKSCFLNPNVWVGRNTLLSPEVVIITMEHEFDDRLTPIRNQGYKASVGPVVIGEDVWVGTRATILPGVSVGDGAVVGACSVVTKNVPAWAVVAGNPARVIAWRGGEPPSYTRVPHQDGPND